MRKTYLVLIFVLVLFLYACKTKKEKSGDGDSSTIVSPNLDKNHQGLISELFASDISQTEHREA